MAAYIEAGLIVWAAVLVLFIGLRLRADAIERRQDFRDTGDFVQRTTAYSAPTAAAVQTPAPTAPLSLAQMHATQAEARCAAREDYIDNRRRRANPHRRHTRQFALWAIAYDEEWTRYELAAGGCTESLQSIPDRTA